MAKSPGNGFSCLLFLAKGRHESINERGANWQPNAR